MAETEKPVFLVNAYSDPVVIKVNGKANFLNSSPIRDFFQRLAAAGKRTFVVDFNSCTGMDSTFLGILAGAALETRTLEPPGSLIFCRMGKRNLELVRNLGLHRIVKVDAGDFPMSFEEQDKNLNHSQQSELESAKMVLKAHENLVAIDDANQVRFQDVLSFLKNQIDRQ